MADTRKSKLRSGTEFQFFHIFSRAPIMASTGRHDVTRLLDAVSTGQCQPTDDLLQTVYEELRALAEHFLHTERPDHTLQATALVHEAYLRLVDQRNVRWQNRAHFIAIAAQAMRRVLVDHARGQLAQKRGSRKRVLLSDVTPIASLRDVDLLALDEALHRLEQIEPLDARIVEMRALGGLTVQEVAEVVKVDEKTVRRHWNYATAWLYRELTKGDSRQGVPARKRDPS
jgi:RNA polymerase sigma-70 factor (ECF subfamily)